MFSNAQTGGGGGGLFGNKPAGGGGGLFGNQQQGAAGGGGGGGLFGNQQQGAGAGAGGGGLFGGQQQKPGGLFGGQQQAAGGGGGGLFANTAGGGAAAGGGGGLFGNKPAGTTLGTGGGSLFSGGGAGAGAGGGGGLFNKPAGTGGGGLFPSAGGAGGAGAGSQFSLFPGQRPGVGQGGMFGGPGMGGYPDLAAKSKQSRFQLSLTNPIRDRKVGTLGDKYKQFVEAASKTLNTNERQIETLKIVNEDIVKKKAELSGITYQFSQDAKLLYMKIKQARYIVDDMKSSLGTYEDITTRNFDVCLDLLKGGRLPRLDMPSNFLINITEYFDLRIKELKDKIGEIEELIKLTDMNEDSEEYEKIVIVIDELYNYYLNIAHKVFQLNEYVSSFKAQFIDYFKSQGSREVERIFTTRTTDSERVDILGRLETISNYVLENKAKKEKEQEDIAKSLTKQGQTY